MKKNWGVSFIELIVTIGIAGILLLISIPNLTDWYRRDQFLAETQKIMDMINDARTASLSKKNCDGLPAEYWNFQVLNDIPTNSQKIGIICKNKNDEKIIDNFTLNKDINSFKVSVLISRNSTDEWIENHSGVHYRADINFKNNSNEITTVGSSFLEIKHVKKLKINFKFKKENLEDKDLVRTVCFDSKAGFPTISKTNGCLE